jgi:hypothetical protein
MQPVQFQCGLCGKLMAVGNEHLGQQVRCPHCQQVVVAPPPAAPAMDGPAAGGMPVPPGPPPGLTETVLHMPPAEGNGEDIFSPEDVSDDLFGRSEAPRVEMPPESSATTLADDNAVPPPQLEATLSSTLPWMPPPEPAAAPPSPSVPFGGSEGTDILPPVSAAPWMSSTATEILGAPPPEMPPSVEVPLAPAGESSAALPRARQRTEAKVPWFMLVVFCPLLLYAIVITIFSFLLYRHEQGVEEKLRRFFDIMPDEGDKPGVQKEKQIRLWKYEPELPLKPLPDDLRTTLGKPLRIGDLEVTPVRVEREHVKVVVESFDPEPCTGDSLVLYLRMKNLSSDYAFAPLDNYFDRRWEAGALPPFTLLEVGDKYRFYGGPARWYPLGDPRNRREWVVGRKNHPDVLRPGGEEEFIVCTNGYDPKAVAVLFGGESRPYHGLFLWRVRVRRGLVHFEGKDRSKTAVIGVRFSDKDIRNAPPQAQ